VEQQTRNASISTGSSGLLIRTGQVTCTYTHIDASQRRFSVVSAPCRRCWRAVLLELADTGVAEGAPAQNASGEIICILDMQEPTMSHDGHADEGMLKGRMRRLVNDLG
jgi:hypothetical protein